MDKARCCAIVLLALFASTLFGSVSLVRNSEEGFLVHFTFEGLCKLGDVWCFNGEIPNPKLLVEYPIALPPSGGWKISVQRGELVPVGDSILPPGWVESPMAQIKEMGWFRDVRVGKLILSPVVLRNGRVYVYKNLRVSVRFTDSSTGKPIEEEGGLFLNQPSGFLWGRERLQRYMAPAKSKDVWEYSCAVSKDGVYVLPFELFDASLEGTPITMIRVTSRGKDVPFLVVDGGDERFSPGDWIEFWGEAITDSLGGPEYYAWENVYWVSFGEDDGWLMGNLPSYDTTGVQWCTHTREHIHIEEDSLFYRFYRMPKVDNGWIWKVLTEGDSIDIPLNLVSCAVDSSFRDTVIISLILYSSSSSSGEITVLVDSTEVFSGAVFRGRTDIVGDFPSGYLTENSKVTLIVGQSSGVFLSLIHI